MSVRKFDEIWPSDGEEKKRFVNRINNGLLMELQGKKGSDYAQFLHKVCLILGEDYTEYRYDQGYASLTALAHDFQTTMRLVSAVYQASSGPEKVWISDNVKKILNLSGNALSITWDKGVLYPSGDTLLDKELISTSLQFLDKFPEERKDLLNALKSLGTSNGKEVITNCYTALEGVARKVLGNAKTLDNNRTGLLAKLGLSNSWSAILSSFITYAHEYRHAGEDRHELNRNEVEAFLYTTCLLIRLVLGGKK